MSTEKNSNSLDKKANIKTLPLGAIIPGLVIVLFISITLGVSIGPVKIPLLDVWSIALHKVGLLESGNWSQAHENIVWLIRFPRVLMAVFVGSGLSIVGVTMQALVRNLLADPYILGISSGASVGAISVLAFNTFAFAGVYAISFGAFLGALLTFVMVFILGQKNGKMMPGRLILAGVAISYFFSGLTSFISMTSSNRELARDLLSWLLGSLAGSNWLELTLPAIAILLGSLFLLLQARSLNALSMGDETASTLGVNINHFRRILFFVASLITGIMVAVSGAIGFIGLMIPHFVRMFVGPDHRRVLPVSIFAGGIFLIWVDLLARTAFAPLEVPVGVITSLLGGPFFIWLLLFRSNKPGGVG
jgi:iron complex transport system permease protein